MLLGVRLSQVADMGMSLCLHAYLQSTSGTSADSGCLLLYRGKNKELWQHALVNKVSLLSRHKPLYTAYFGRWGKTY